MATPASLTEPHGSTQDDRLEFCEESGVDGDIVEVRAECECDTVLSLGDQSVAQES